jgi:hypothetical protein
MRRDPKLAAALRYGDWTTFAGQALSITDDHICDVFDIPDHWPVWMGLDWGYHAPFAAGWMAKDPDTGRHYAIQELYQRGLTDRQQARSVREWSRWRVQIRYADPSLWTRKNVNGIVTTTADEYHNEGVVLTPADNDRLGGKRKVDRLLQSLPDGRPGLLFFSCCTHTIRTMRTLPYSRTGNVEDVDTDAEDHCYDWVRYALTRTSTDPVRKRAQPNRQDWRRSKVL